MHPCAEVKGAKTQNACIMKQHQVYISKNNNKVKRKEELKKTSEGKQQSMGIV